MLLTLLLSAPSLAVESTEQISQQILLLSNQAREKAGLKPLQLDIRLTQAARQHAQEMDTLGYFGHESPIAAYATLAKRLNGFGVYGLTSAENLHREHGYGSKQVGQRAVQAWMNSLAHRKNLLNPRYNRVGLGISQRGDQFTITQDFSYMAIEVVQRQVVAKSQGFHLNLKCKVLDGPRHGALLHEGKRYANWKADEEGQFHLDVDVPGPGLISLGQADGERSWIVETEFAVCP